MLSSNARYYFILTAAWELGTVLPVTGEDTEHRSGSSARARRYEAADLKFEPRSVSKARALHSAAPHGHSDMWPRWR